MEPQELAGWFDNTRHVLELAYLLHDEPWRQSGMSGPEDRWVSLRKPVADCIEKSGTFLDIGCANGYLLECCLGWTAERGITIIPFGLDLSPKLIDLAKQRLPQFSDHFYIGNGLYWQPPMKFNYVRTELVYVPAEYEKGYIHFLLEEHLAPGGRLLIANYMEGMAHPERGALPGSYPTRRIGDRLKQLGFSPIDYRDGFDPIKNRTIRIAILKK